MEREIFSYHNGEKNVKADPMNILRRLMSQNPAWEADLKKVALLGAAANSENPDMVSQALAAYDRVFTAARYAFQVEPYSGDDQGEKGLTDSELTKVIFSFSSFMDSIKKKQGG